MIRSLFFSAHVLSSVPLYLYLCLSRLVWCLVQMCLWSCFCPFAALVFLHEAYPLFPLLSPKLLLLLDCITLPFALLAYIRWDKVFD